MECQLDTEQFICCKCGNTFNHVDGTWLPIGVTPQKLKTVGLTDSLKMVSLDLREPEIVTSDKFTCYDCL